MNTNIVLNSNEVGPDFFFDWMSASSPVSDHFSVEQGDERDYSTRLGDILGESDEERQESGSDDEEGFVYDGADAEMDDAEASGPYREQLSEILEQSLDELDELEDEEHVEKLLLRDTTTNPPEPSEVQLEQVPDTPNKLPFRRPGFLHPNVSRLRSYASQKRSPSSSSIPSISNSGLAADPTTPTGSHLSTISRTSSTSNIHEYEGSPSTKDKSTEHVRVPFRWSTMKGILPQISSSRPAISSQKAAAILGSGTTEIPTVMAANGLICIGTTQGRVFVFDFKQNLRTVCVAKDIQSPVTALALSPDRTFVAAGHLSGHIHLYDLSDSNNKGLVTSPARSVPTHARAAVASGRREGHLHNARITALDFVGARRTAIVSTDEYGMAFYHSLGKVLFVEASDVLRLLGKHPLENIPSAMASPVVEDDGSRSQHSTIKGSKRGRSPWIRQSPPILAMASLPLGTNVHPTDAYNVIALLTPVKLVIVALKPSAKTWLRKRRLDDRYAAVEASGKEKLETKIAGCMAWFPSVSIKDDDNGGESGKGATMKTTLPTLVYTWGSNVKLLRIREELPEHLKLQQQASPKTLGRKGGMPHELGRLVFEDAEQWTAGGDVRGVQWLTPHQVVLALDSSMEVWDIRDGCKLIETAKFSITTLTAISLRIDERKIRSYEGSFRAYKGKLFLLGAKEIIVGTLLSWTDHILNLVSHGDSLAAINLATAYHLNTAPGNQNGLPRNLDARRTITSNQLRELVQASVRHAFSPERLVDATHRTADNRGVDRTSLFEGLIPACVQSCLALDDLDFLYEEVFEDYDSNGIARMFLKGIEPFLLDGTLSAVPVWITQRLVAMHVEEEEFEEAEALIWHLDPESLDVDQAIGLCRQQQLWDALIYVYTRALRDYVAPVVELLVLVRAVQRYRLTASLTGGLTATMEQEMEKKTMSAYKIFPYIAATLSGLTYPSQTPLPKDESNVAKAALYGFLVDGRSRLWPEGPNGKLVLTSDEEGGAEPTYPYLRLLLRFDPESMLHTLDIAFEDSYLNDDNQGVGRLIIVKILLEMLGGGSFSEGDATLVRIFVARNVPKYPQYIRMPPSLLHNVLIGLAEDQDAETREDRQLAAEYLLSAYKPRDGDDLITLFEEAGFYRILRTRFRAEKQWSALLEAYLQDEDISSSELFRHLDEVLVSSSSKKGGVPRDVALVALEALPRLLDVDIGRTALFVDQRMPDQHPTAIHHLRDDEERRLIYLRTLLQPSKMRSGFGDEESIAAPSKNVDADLQRLFFEGLCRTAGDDVVEALQSTKENALSYEDLLPIFKKESAHDAVIFSLRAINKDGDAVEYIETACRTEGDNIMSIWESSMGPKEERKLEKILHRVERMVKMGVSLCQTPKDPSLPADKQWLRLLQSEILLVQSIVDAGGQWPDESSNRVIETLRGLTHESFDALILHASAQGISFPQLFKELVTSTTQANKYSSNPSTELYSEFRMILTGMLDTYRYEGELLTTTSALINRDVNNTFEEWTRQLQIGWRAPRTVCGNCHRNLVVPDGDSHPAGSGPKVTVNASGQIFHVTCPV